MIKQLPDSTIPLTDAENELIDKIIQELDTDDAKELEACRDKLSAAEQEILSLKAQLKKEENRNLLTHKQLLDLYNKLKLYEKEKKDSPIRRKQPSKHSLFSHSDADDANENLLTACFKRSSCQIS